uniref:DALR anticodon binding domain-containing protein n=1 Tax=Trichuris muris TaxID=70415 RepID=A0A5S6QVQ4_TRIMR
MLCHSPRFCALEESPLASDKAERSTATTGDEVAFLGAVFSDWDDSRAIAALRTLLFARSLCKTAQSAGMVARLVLPIPADFDVVPDCAKVYQSWQNGMNVTSYSTKSIHSTRLDDLLSFICELVKRSNIVVIVYPEFWSASTLLLRANLQRRNVRVVCVSVGNVRVNRNEPFKARDYIRIRLQQVEQLHKVRRNGGNNEQDELVVRLCACVVAFELLLPKACKPISVNLDPACGLPERSKRGIFVMYNYARIASVIRQFSSDFHKDNDAFTPLEETTALPDECFQNGGQFAELVGNILRKQPFAEDWIRTVLNEADSSCFPIEPRLCLQLAEFSNCFSKTYSKLQILPPRLDLVTQTVFLRVHVLWLFRRWMLHLFKLLSLQEIEQM